MTMPVDLDAIRPIAGADPDRDTRAENVDRAVQGAELLLRQAVVVGVDVPNGRCTVAIGGDTDNPVPGVKHLSNYRPKLQDSCWILVNGYDLLVLDRTTNLGPSVISDALSATLVATDFTTSTLWTPLQGPLLNGISVSPSGRLLVQVSALLYNLTSGSYGALMGVNLAHSEMDFSIAPIETSSQITYGTAANAATAASKVILFTGLPAGTYSAQAMYLSLNGGGAQFQYRHIWALPL
jgi:hypothetical protein